jgi:hypothetical protein
MGLMDRVRAQANQLAQQAQDAAQEGRNRIDQAQSGRRGDVLLRQLGALVYAERTGRGTADSQAKIDQLINDISAHESQNGLNLTDPPQSGLQSMLGQSVFGQQQSPGQAPGGPQPTSQSGFGQPPGPPPGTGPTGSPADAGPAGGGHPQVDTSTNFFPVPGDDEAGGSPEQS